MSESINDKVDSPSRQTGMWGFVGYFEVGKNQEQRVGICVSSNYADGRAIANAWMRDTARPIRWEAEPIHESLETVLDEVTLYTDSPYVEPFDASDSDEV